MTHLRWHSGEFGEGEKTGFNIGFFKVKDLFNVLCVRKASETEVNLTDIPDAIQETCHTSKTNLLSPVCK